jgi:hypothetical protein
VAGSEEKLAHELTRIFTDENESVFIRVIRG